MCRGLRNTWSISLSYLDLLEMFLETLNPAGWQISCHSYRNKIRCRMTDTPESCCHEVFYKEREKAGRKEWGVDKVNFIIKMCENINKNKRKESPICQNLGRLQMGQGWWWWWHLMRKKKMWLESQGSDEDAEDGFVMCY